MSWNKNTHNCSNINAMIKTLDNIGNKYILTEIGTVRGMGLNDEYCPEHQDGLDSDGNYKLRKLEYAKASGEIVIIMEQMQRSYDCDCDDFIISHTVNNPDEYPIEVYIHDDDFSCTKNCSCKEKTLLFSKKIEE